METCENNFESLLKHSGTYKFLSVLCTFRRNSKCLQIYVNYVELRDQYCSKNPYFHENFRCTFTINMLLHKNKKSSLQWKLMILWSQASFFVTGILILFFQCLMFLKNGAQWKQKLYDNDRLSERIRLELLFKQLTVFGRPKIQ